MSLQTTVRPGLGVLVRPAPALLAVFAVWTVSLLAYAQGLTNSDVAWYLIATDKWLSGARLYEDIIEINPPLIFALNVPPVSFSRVSGLPAELLIVVYVHLLIALSLLVSARVLAAWPRGIRRLGPAVLLAGGLALCTFAIFDFGQREHLLTIFTLPYVLLVISRAGGGPLPAGVSIGVGLLAALGFGLKPHFLAVPFLLEVYLMARRRDWRVVFRPESLGLAAALILYAGTVVWLTPEYFTRILPFALLAYGAYSQSLIVVLLSWQTLIVPFLLIVHLLSRRYQARPEIADVFLIASAAYYVIYVVQLKNWTYHEVPAESFSFLALFALALADPLLKGGRGRRIILGALAVAAMLAIPYQRGPFRFPDFPLLLSAVEAQAQGRPVFTLSSYLWVSFPIVNRAGSAWSSRFPCLWLLPGALLGLESPEAARDPALRARYEALKRYTLDAVVEDLRAGDPGLIVVDRRPDPRFKSLEFDYVAFFTQDPRFAAIWANYRHAERVESEGIGPYDLYVRVTP